MIYTHAASFLAGLAVAAVSTWHVQSLRYDAQISSIQAKHARESAEAEAATRAAEQSFALQLQKAQDESAKRETKLRADADAARRTVDGLRGTLYNFRASLPNAAPAAVIARADTAAELLGACVSEYRGVAESADRHAADAVMLLDAWPSKPR